jgi:hypothetical protein
LPDGPIRQSLFRRIHAVLEELMQPQPSGERALRVSETVEVLEFLCYAAQINSGSRPKSRRYLDWLTSMTQEVSPAEHAGGLILPS